MPLNSLNRLRGLRSVLVWCRCQWLRHVVGVIIDPTATLSLSSRLVSGGRGSISVGAETLIAFKTLIYSRDTATGEVRPVRIGSRCFIGGGSMILPGVTIGDEAIVGAGAVVSSDVAARTIVGGNPARPVRQDIEVGPFGRLAGADDNSRRMWVD
jgi:acetyltransferase-like isoleucine patch superfamily enzyme